MNMTGQLGDANRSDKLTPLQILSERTFTGVSAKGTHSFAVDSEGNLWAFGTNMYGQLGDGTTSNRNSPGKFGSSNPDGDEGRYLVVYYTWSGRSRSLATDIAQTLDCDIVEVELTTPYSATSDSELYPVAQAEIAAIDNNGTYPSIRTTVDNIADYDAVVVVYPLWYSRMATPMQSFLHNYGSALGGKTVALVCTSASSSISGTVSDA